MRRDHKGKKPKVQVFKIQRPLAGAPMCFVYNEDRSYEGQFPMTDDILPIFRENLKVYVKAEVNSDGRLDIKEYVQDPGW